MWATLNEKRQEIHAALMADDDETTIEMLSRPDRNELFYGIDTLSKISVDGLQTPAVQTQIEDTIVNHLSATAETIGAIDVYNPEAGKPRPDFDAEVILSAIDAVLGCKVQCPANFANEFGLVTSRGLVTYKVPISIYHAHRIMQISRLVGGRRVSGDRPGHRTSGILRPLYGIHGLYDCRLAARDRRPGNFPFCGDGTRRHMDGW